MKINGKNYIFKGKWERGKGENAHLDVERNVYVGCGYNRTKYGTPTKFNRAYTIHKIYELEEN